MTRLKLRRGTIRVRKRVEVVHVVDNKGAVACSLEGGVDLVFAKDGSLPLSGEKGEVCISVVDNVMPAARVS